MVEKQLSIKSKRNSNINCTVVDSETDNAKLVLFIHGFRADRTEGGRFLRVAGELSSCGVSSIMMSFAGCEGSDEDFINYTLTNNLDDMETAYEYMLDNYSVNTSRIGVIGYSMGGRLASIFVNKHPEVKTLALWAGYCTQGFGGDYFLGVKVEDMCAEASVKGYYDFLNTFDGMNLQLNRQLLDDINDYDIYESLNKYSGSVIVIHGDKDDTVSPSVSKEAYRQLMNAKSKELVLVKDADHGFGIWDGHPEQSDELVNKTCDFFKKYL